MKIEASCTITVSIEDISVNSIELAALQGAKETGKKLLLVLLGVVEKTLSKDRTCKCRGHLESKGRVPRELMSLIGDILFILFMRQKLRCLRCGKERYLLDEALGIVPRRLVMLGLREKALWLVAEMAYDRAS